MSDTAFDGPAGQDPHLDGRLAAAVLTRGPAVLLTDRAGVVLTANAAAERLWGLPLVGVTVGSLLDPLDRRKWSAFLGQVCDGVLDTISVSVRVSAAPAPVPVLQVTGTSLLDDPDVRGVVLTSHHVRDAVESTGCWDLSTGLPTWRWVARQLPGFADHGGAYAAVIDVVGPLPEPTVAGRVDRTIDGDDGMQESARAVLGAIAGHGLVGRSARGGLLLILLADDAEHANRLVTAAASAAEAALIQPSGEPSRVVAGLTAIGPGELAETAVLRAAGLASSLAAEGGMIAVG